MTREDIISRLEEAGATLICLPQDKAMWYLRGGRYTLFEKPLNVVFEFPKIVPSAEKISRMDAAWEWLSHIPNNQMLLRRIVAVRSLVHPISYRNLYSWRRLGTLIGADHKAIQRWHTQGIAIIAQHLKQVAA